MGKEQHPQSPHSNRERRRSASKDRVRRDSLDSVAYEKVQGQGEEVSIGMEWSGDGVSMSTDITAHGIAHVIQS